MFTHAGVPYRWSRSVLVAAIGAVGIVTVSGGCFAGGFGFVNAECTALATQEIELQLAQELEGANNGCTIARLHLQQVDAGCISSTLGNANAFLETLGIPSTTIPPEEAEAQSRERALEEIEELCQ